MSDDRIGVDYGSADYVGDVWHDDHANGTDSCCRRLLCGNSAVRGTRRRIKKPEKKKALNRPKYQRQRKNITPLV